VSTGAVTTPRILVAGVGNILRADDGFGPAVVQALLARGLPDGVHAVELGIGGIGLVHELMDGYDALVIVDAIDRGGAPGTVYVLDPDVPDIDRITAGDRQALGDLHETVPARALVLARAAGVLPPDIRIIGCQPGETDELCMRLTAAVEAAVATTIGHILAFVAEVHGVRGEDELRQRDDVLQMLFWLDGEGFGPDVPLADVLRFTDSEDGVRAALTRLVADGLLEACGDGTAARYRLTPIGRREGGRRFLDEFEPFLARGGHGECGVANCDCHRGGACQNPP